MAEEATYLNVALSQANRPTIFELIAQEGMQQCLRPAAQFIARNLAENYPHKFKRLFSYFDEIYLIFDLFLEGHHIATFDASFGEHFYGLQRVFSTNLLYTYLSGNSVTVDSTKLNLRGKILSLISLSVLPYIYNKIEKQYQIIEEKEANFGILSRREKNFLLIFRYASAIHQIIEIILKISYLTKRTEFYSLILSLQCLKIARISETDQSDSELPYFSQLSSRSNLMNLFLIPFGAANLIGYSFSHILPFCAFLVKFMEHWYAQHNQGILEVMKSRLPVPPPPPQSTNHEVNRCPICHKPLKDPSAVSASGYVYCYLCITSYIRTMGICPASGLVVDINDVIRIYSSSSGEY